LWVDDPTLRHEYKTRLEQGVRDFDSATITTIHGFCDRLLSLMGISADHDLSDQMTASFDDIIQEATTDHYCRLAQESTPWFTLDLAQKWVRAALQDPNAQIHPLGEEAQFTQEVRSSVYRRLRRHGLYTFDDMITRCHQGLINACDDVAGRVSRAYPILLVDEFQDTDEAQWEIIERGFVGRSTVVLIGDPKQSIYSFRGADIKAYMKATHGATTTTLTTNFRSSAKVVNALNHLLGGAELGETTIKVTPISPCEHPPHLAVEPPWDQPIRLRLPSDLTPRSATEARDMITTDLGHDVIRLLNSSANFQSHPSVEPRPLRPDDIAVLVSTNDRGLAIAEHFQHHGIPGLFTGSSSVFSTQAAQDWLRLLRAMDFGTPGEIRLSSLTSFFGWDLHHLVGIDSNQFSALAVTIRHLGTLMDRGGAHLVLEWLSDHSDLTQRLSGDATSARCLADLHHLATLFPVRDTRGALGWLEHQRMATTSRDETSRTIATSSDAVRILTVHQAKGLQFPVVYCPQLSDRFDSISSKKPVVAHDSEGNRVLDLGIGTTTSPLRAIAQQESAAESLRMCYVALTRAITQITTWWVPTMKTTTSSPLHRLLFSSTDTPPSSSPMEGCDPHGLTIPGLAVETINASSEPTGHISQKETPPPVGEPLELHRPIDTSYRRTSFSSLTAQAHHSSTMDQANAHGEDPELNQVSPLADFPGGLAFGSLVHNVFEYATPGEDLTELISATMRKEGFTGFSPATLAEGLQPGLDTPLGDIAGGRSLSQIPLRDRLAELNFEFPLSLGQQSFTLTAIASCLRSHLEPDSLLSTYPDFFDDSLDLRDLRGYLSGAIDAVLRVNDRYVVADYKTNRLAPPDTPLTLGHYTYQPMALAMMDSHYLLQGLIYQVALHRFLRWRIDAYDPEVHLGGMAYLFVRGMAGEETPVRQGTTCGVFTWIPPTAMILELSDLFSGVIR
jgi:exodeoxyribonuclease V beta subunit